jgi:hypothetical protein
MSSSRKSTFHDKAMPSSLSKLPRFGITSRQTSSRSDSERDDIAFGVSSLGDLENLLSRGFGDLDRPKPSPKRSKTRR